MAFSDKGQNVDLVGRQAGFGSACPFLFIRVVVM